MSKILIVGDCHIGKGLSIGKPGIGNTLNSRVIDQIKLLNFVIETATENEVSHIIFTGDIFEDSRPEPQLINIFINVIKICEAHDIEVHIVAGNHDMEITGGHISSVLDIIEAFKLPKTYLYKQIDTIYIDKIGITLMPFRDRTSLGCKSNTEAVNKIIEQLPYELQSIPSYYDKLIVGHLSIAGAMYVGDEVDDLANEIMMPADSFVGYDYVWMGHVHKPQVLSKKMPYVAHIGSLDISDFGETDHTKILILYDNNNKNKFTQLPVPTRNLHHIKINVPKKSQSTEYVIKKINDYNNSNSIENSIIKINVKLTDEELENIDRKKIENKIYELKAFHVASLSESRSKIKINNDKKTNIDQSITPKEAIKLFTKKLIFDNEKDKSTYKSYALEVINSI